MLKVYWRQFNLENEDQRFSKLSPVLIHAHLINDWSAILLCLSCIIFHEYMCGFLLFTEFWCLAMRFSGCYEIWLSHRQNNIFLINDWSSILLCLLCIIFHKYAGFPVCRILVFCYEIKLL